jgi:hypothetical protein
MAWFYFLSIIVVFFWFFPRVCGAGVVEWFVVKRGVRLAVLARVEMLLWL